MSQTWTRWGALITKTLSAAHVSSVDVQYSGAGDSGGIDEVIPRRGLHPVTTPLPNLNDEILYAILSDTLAESGYEGWELNDGSSGTMTLTANGIDLSHQFDFYSEGSEQCHLS